MRSFSGVSAQTMGRAKLFELLRQGGLRTAALRSEEDANEVEPLRFAKPVKARPTELRKNAISLSSEADTFDFKPAKPNNLTELYPELQAASGIW